MVLVRQGGDKLNSSINCKSKELICNRLRGLRAELKLSIEDVSRATGIATTTIQAMENGSRKMYIDKLLPILDFYKIRLDFFIESSFANNQNKIE